MTVLVVGAGPAGLATAITLARYGVPTLVVERRPEPSPLPRATGISTRTMELVRSWGLEERVRAGGVDVRWQAWIGPSLVSPHGIELDTVWPHPDVVARLSPTAPACVPQDALEAVLLDHLTGFAHVEVRFGTELVAVRQADGVVEVTLRDVGTGAVSGYRPDYLVAADGARSPVRNAIGIETEEVEGGDGPRGVLGSPWLGARATLFTATLPEGSLWDVLGERRHLIYTVTNPEASGVLLPAGDGRWLFGQDCDLDAPTPAYEVLADQIATAIGLPGLRPTVLRTGTFRFDAAMARRYRDGAVFLVGDAAHRMTPRGGTGLNTAVHDGHDLGWKLAWVTLGWASPELLDSYETEREPVGRRNTTLSAQSVGSYRDPAEELDFDLGGRVTHAWVDHADGNQNGDTDGGVATHRGTGVSGRISTLDLLGPGLTVLTGPDAPAADMMAADRQALGPALGATLTARVPIKVWRLDGRTAEALGIPAGGSLTLRPDGKPAVHSASDLVAAGHDR
ncbi:FAD-dependent monooxygenase [Pseudofrankia saprophytica]|uniref:FAD-dependent monooxygenase n=1 Tax=Pseudofrankia saprophytica TaxID=298655 RepID=UPI0002ED3B10|nr:FAD-dependent monooxygenase [Pseudofrankia saprophytica]